MFYLLSLLFILVSDKPHITDPHILKTPRLSAGGSLVVIHPYEFLILFGGELKQEPNGDPGGI